MNGLMQNANHGEITEVQYGGQALAVTESNRVVAETQAQLTVASARPRDEMRAIAQIKTSCQRERLAQSATYTYAKGGREITGPSIRLLECCARHWGNLNFGFRILSQSSTESTVEVFAWDLQSNTKETRTFVVPHFIQTRNGPKEMTDPRDIYELIANQSSRRVRSCLEHLIPNDVWEDAMDECGRTIAAKIELSPDRIKGMLESFKSEFGVSREQIEKRIQRKVDSIRPAQFIDLINIHKSLKDEMSAVSDWFDEIEPSEPHEWEVVCNECEQVIRESEDRDEMEAAFSRVESFPGMPGAEVQRIGKVFNERCEELAQPVD